MQPHLACRYYPLLYHLKSPLSQNYVSILHPFWINFKGQTKAGLQMLYLQFYSKFWVLKLNFPEISFSRNLHLFLELYLHSFNLSPLLHMDLKKFEKMAS